MEWYNEPTTWSLDNDVLSVRADAKTDFWRITHYDFIRDNGHFYGQTVSGDFVYQVKVVGQYASKYDQAGVMVRIDAQNWLKCGIEYVDGVQYASTVVTREFSDWSVTPLSGSPEAIWLRVKRESDALEVQYSLDASAWTMIRLAYFPPNLTASVGVMAAAPDGDGFAASFSEFSLSQ